MDEIDRYTVALTIWVFGSDLAYRVPEVWGTPYEPHLVQDVRQNSSPLT
jgi:hypothetical protein